MDDITFPAYPWHPIEQDLKPKLKMKSKKNKASKILKEHVCKEDIDSLSINVWDDIIDSMIEFAEEDTNG